MAAPLDPSATASSTKFHSDVNRVQMATMSCGFQDVGAGSASTSVSGAIVDSQEVEFAAAMVEGRTSLSMVRDNLSSATSRS